MKRSLKRFHAAWKRLTSLTSRSVIYLMAYALVAAIGLFLMALGGTLLIAIGTSLIATGIAGWTLFAYVLLTDRLNKRFEILSDFGLLAIFKERSLGIRDVYESRLDQAEEHIDLLGFGQRAFRQDFAERFPMWLGRGVHIRILLLDPSFPKNSWSVADQRDREEQNDEGEIKRDVKSFLEKTQALRERHEKFEVKLYRCLPTVNVLRIDDELFWGPYLLKKPSRSAPTLLVELGELYDVMLQHFESIWDDDELSRYPSCEKKK